MFDFNKPKIEITELSEDKKFGRFVVEPLERGYGTTLGNSLRRIMLSSLPGAAVSQVKIDGVLHEFSSIPGVKEDVSDIIMNLKSLAIKNHSTDNEPKTAYIECEGKGVVTAADIQADQDIEIMNPDQVIATLNGGKDCRLAMELTITKGRGYISADKGKSDDMPIGVLAVDAIYTPVDRVNMTVENTRVGQVTDYDKLTLDVYTNGTLDPDEAVSLAAKSSTLLFIPRCIRSLYIRKLSITLQKSSTASSAAAEGVGALKSATKSAMVKSVSCPTAEITGVLHSKIARATISSLKAQRSSMDPPPRPTMITSTPASSSIWIPFTILSAAPSP